MKSLNLYHLSFNPDLEGTCTPRSPDGAKEGNQDISITAESNQPRICVAPTITQCFQGIYPNVKHYFEVKKYPYLNMKLYKAILTKDTVFKTPKELTDNLEVWDAFVTEEHWILTPVEMKLVSEVRIFKHNALGRMKVHPFNDPNIDKSGEKYYVEPNIVKYIITKQY